MCTQQEGGLEPSVLTRPLLPQAWIRVSTAQPHSPELDNAGGQGAKLCV